MTKRSRVSRWVLFGVSGIPLPLALYFYLILHVHFGVPVRELIAPALIFCAFVPLFAVGACWGARARAKGDSRLLFLVLGLFAVLCGMEFSYFEMKLGATPHDRSSYAFTLVWATIITVGAYLLDRSIAKKSRDGADTK